MRTAVFYFEVTDVRPEVCVLDRSQEADDAGDRTDDFTNVPLFKQSRICPGVEGGLAAHLQTVPGSEPGKRLEVLFHRRFIREVTAIGQLRLPDGNETLLLVAQGLKTNQLTTQLGN